MNSKAHDLPLAAAYDTPGVYYETLAKTRVQPPFRTGIPVFVGFAEAAPSSADKTGIRRIDHWQQFAQWYKSAQYSYLGYAVRGFFENGGERCIIVPVQCEPDLSRPENMISALASVFEEGGLLEDIEDVDLVCIPDAGLDIIRKTRDDAVLEIQSEVLEHCRRMGDRFAILAGIQDHDDSGLPREPAQLEQPITQWRKLPPEHGALYFPWIYVEESLRAGSRGGAPFTEMPCERVSRRTPGPGFKISPTLKRVPPCGHIAGIYARTDARTGVHKAPANEALEGVFKLGLDLNDREQGMLNTVGINCLRSFPGRGIRVWGARTLSGQPDWLYVNVRRLFLTLTRWIRQNMNDLVYEENTPSLWRLASQRLFGYCHELFDRGALAGNSPAEAFFIKCDAETNSAESREAGFLVTDVGLAPVIPFEFVVVRITQSASAVTVTGSNIS